MSLTVKAYILRQGEANPEIRRFAVDQDVSTNYDYLRGKVTQMFPALKNKAFQLYWRDNENDQILFSSDDELTEALGFVSDGVFKIYIKEIEKSGPREQPDQSVLHPGVVCDVCEGEVRGFRFKCLVCPDYDLCFSCEGKGHHPEHDMMRITTPKQTAWMGFGGMFPPPPYHDGQGPPPPFCPPQPGAGPCGPPPHGPWGHGPFGPGGRGRGRGGHHWRRMMNRWKRWMTGEEESPEKKNGTDKKGKTEEGKKQESRKGDEVPRDKKEQNESTDEEAGEGSTEDFLRNVGHNVAAMLDPLGIDVEIDVEHKGNKQKCGATGQGGQFGPMGWATWGPQGRGGRHHGRQGGHCPWGAWSMGGTFAQSNPTSAEQNPDEKKQNDDTVEMETGETSTKPKTKSTEDGSSTMDTEEVSSSAGVQNAEDPPKAPSPDKEWTFVESRSQPAEGACQSQDGVTGGLYPQVPEAADSAAPKDPVIANALDHMNAMGFTDDGGWLTRLLEVTSGDINKALDAIRANRNK